MSGGGKGAKAPKAPDYTALAQQQGAINQQTANQLTAANRPNQYDPFGNSITWSQSESPEYAQAMAEYNSYLKDSAPMVASGKWGQREVDQDAAKLKAKAEALKGQGQWSQQQTLNPETKAAWEKYMRDANQAGSKYGDLLNNYLSNYSQAPGYADFAGGPQMGQFASSSQRLNPFSSDAAKINPFTSSAQNVKGYNDPEFEGKAVADALYGSVMDRGRKEQARETDSLNTQLRNSGLVPGSEAYNRAMQNLMTSQNDANLLAGQNATLAGANEGRSKYASYLSGNQAQFGNDVTGYGTNLQGQAQDYGQDLSGYMANLQRQAQDYGQDLSGYMANLGANAQNYAQSANTYGINSQNYQMNRNQPLQELAGMAGIAGGQPYSPVYQGFSGATGYNPTDLVGAAQAQFGAKQGAANASNSKKGGLLGAGASLGGSYLGSK